MKKMIGASVNNLCKVTVVIPTYNRKHVLLNVIDSIRNQTVTDIEILVCDDGSTDGTSEEVKKIENVDARIKYIFCGHNGSPAIPRNIGIQHAKGEWIAFCDDDDIWYNNKLESQIEALDGTTCKACCSNAMKVYNNTEYLFHNKVKSILTFKDLLEDNAVICSSMLVEKSLMRQSCGFTNHMEIEDYGCWLKVAAMTDIIYLDEPLLEYHVHSLNSRSQCEKDSLFTQKKHIIKEFRKWASHNHIKYNRLILDVVMVKQTTVKIRNKIREFRYGYN